MTRYFDTGIVLKLYTTEKESPAVRRFVTRGKEPLFLNSLHRSECVSAFGLKAFCGECDDASATSAINDFEDDIATGVIRILGIDWDLVWGICRVISAAHTRDTGCRTLDALHVACARSLAIREFITNDKRQSELAKRVGLRVINPC